MLDISTIDFKYAIWIVPIILLLHELEEWNIIKWHKKHQLGLPGETNLGERMWLLFLSLVGFVWTAIAFLIPDNTISAAWMYMLIDFTLLNGLQHLIGVIVFKEYHPGSFFSVVFGVTADIYLTYLILATGLLPYWAVAILIALVILELAADLIALKQKRAPALVRICSGIGHGLARWMTD